jgi:signal transduction histidine kinase
MRVAPRLLSHLLPRALMPAAVRALPRRVARVAARRGGYELGAAVQRFSRDLAALRDQDGVVDLVLDGLCATLALSGIAFLALPEGPDEPILRVVEAGDLRARGHYATASGQREVLRGLARLDAVALGAPDAPLMLDPWPGCAALTSIGNSGAGEGLALLIIGRKRTGAALRRNDRALLVTVAHQAATALANARLVAGLQTSLAQVRISTTQLVEARAEQRLLLRELVDAEERQRAALARDLHDDALQEVLYLIRHARLCIELAQHAERTAVVRARVDDTPLGGLGGDAAQEGSRAFGAGAGRLTQELRQIAERAELAEQRLRALYQGLYPALLPALGLPAALEELGRELSISGDVSIEADCTAEAREAALGLDGEAALHVYRIAQEALRNADKHAAARAATLRLSLAAAIPPIRPTRPSWHSDARRVLLLEVEDDGRGIALPIDYAALLRQGHLGLAGMRERAERLGGDLAFAARPEGGTRVALLLPLADVAVERAASGARELHL